MKSTGTFIDWLVSVVSRFHHSNDAARPGGMSCYTDALGETYKLLVFTGSMCCEQLLLGHYPSQKPSATLC